MFRKYGFSLLIIVFLLNIILFARGIPESSLEGKIDTDTEVDIKSVTEPILIETDVFSPLKPPKYKLEVLISAEKDLREQLNDLLGQEIRQLKDVQLIGEGMPDYKMYVTGRWIKTAEDKKDGVMLSLAVTRQFDFDKIKANILPEKLEETAEILKETFHGIDMGQYLIPMEKVPEVINQVITIFDTKVLKKE